VSCGYEPTAVIEGFGSLKGFWGMVRGTFSKYKDPHAHKLLQDWQPGHEAPLVQIESHSNALEESKA
jgi:hypothetical protein